MCFCVERSRDPVWHYGTGTPLKTYGGPQCGISPTMPPGREISHWPLQCKYFHEAGHTKDFCADFCTYFDRRKHRLPKPGAISGVRADCPLWRADEMWMIWYRNTYFINILHEVMNQHTHAQNIIVFYMYCIYSMCVCTHNILYNYHPGNIYWDT